MLFSESRRKSAELGIARAMGRIGVKTHAVLLKRMRHEPAALDEVLAELTIGETYFLRDSDQLKFIVETAIAGRTAASGPGRPARIWSAGCSSGEEAYSLAIMTEEARINPPPHIIGTDIAISRLAKARTGRYGDWSFRGVPDRIRSKYFKPEGRQSILDKKIRERVGFSVLNLAEDAYPSAATGVFGMDVILCRNVLIYFDFQTVERVAARLIDSLADGGWLFVGASDPMLGAVCGCQVEMTSAGIAYRRISRATSPTTSVHESRKRTVSVPSMVRPSVQGARNAAPDIARERVGSRARDGTVRESEGMRETPGAAATGEAASAAAAYAGGEYAEAARIASEAARAGRGTAALAVLEVRSLANLGEMDTACARCTELIELHRTVAELHYLHAVLLTESDRPDLAIVAARRATYLEPSLAVAHLALGDAASRAGNDGIAHRAFVAAAELLAEMPGDATVPAADGETALRLLHIARFRLRSIAGIEEPSSSGTRP